jgi:Viral BACON domain
MLPFSLSHRALGKRYAGLTALACAVLLAACGGGGGSGGSDPAPAPPPAPPAPSGISFELEGTATKGVILGGTVRVLDANDITVEIATGTTTTFDGSFDLSVLGSTGFEGQVVKIVVTGGSGAVMVCDAPSGCYDVDFGETFEISDEFELSAIIETPTDGGSATVHVNAITTLAAELMEYNANGDVLDRTDIVAANSQVADLFGLESEDLASLPAVDVTAAERDNNLPADVLRAAYVNAGVLGALLEGSGPLDQRMDVLIQDFTENGGQLIMNEAEDNPAVISMEDVFVSAVETAERLPREGDAFSEANEKLEADYLAIVATAAGTRSSDLPERPVLKVSTTEMSFRGVRGRTVEGAEIHIAGEGIPWKIKQVDPWLTFSRTEGTGPATVRVTPRTDMAEAGQNEGIFIVYDTKAPKQHIVDVSFVMGNELTVSVLDGPALEAVQGSMEALTRRVNVEGLDVSWKAEPLQDWVSVTPSSASQPDFATISMSPTDLAPGKYRADVKFVDTNFDQSFTVGLDVYIEPRRILIEETGVAFSHFPAKSILDREIAVSENSGEPLDWTATDNAAWLTVTPSGQTPGVLTLQADPTGLAAGVVHMAQVEVRTGNTSVQNTEHVEVSLWIGEEDPEERIEITIPATNIVADPVRPYVYANTTNNHPDLDRDVDILNVYTGEIVGVIENVSPQNGVMTVSPDGSFLYVFDVTNNTIIPVDLSTYEIQEGWSTEYLDSLVVRRVNGKEILFTGSGLAYDLATGMQLDADFGLYSYNNSNSVDVSRNGEKLCLMDRGLSPFSLYCFSLTYRHEDGGKISSVYHGDVDHGVGSNGADTALSHDGTIAYTASGSPYQFNVFDTTTLKQVQTLAGSAYPLAAEVDVNGIFYGGINDALRASDIWAYDRDGNLISNYAFGKPSDRLRHRQLVISGDGSRIIAAVSDYYSENGGYTAILAAE